MEKINLIYNYYEGIQDDLKVVDFFRAQNDPNLSLEEKTYLSGLVQFSKVVEKRLQGCKYSLYFDFSSILSTIELPELNDFIFVNNSGKFFVHEFLLKKRFSSLYEWLKISELGIFYHEKFFKNPDSIHGYYSDDNDLLEEDIEELKQLLISKSHKKQVNKSKYFFNKKINIDYHDFKNLVCKKEIFNAHKVFHKNIKIQFLNEKITPHTYLFSIPLIGTLNKRESLLYQGQGGLFVFIAADRPIGKSTIKNLPLELSYLAKEITFNYLVEVGLSLVEKTNIQATKSAISAIMSRNMSHNIGSHVLSYLKAKNYSISDILRNNILKNLITFSDGQSSHIFQSISDEKSIESVLMQEGLPFLIGLGRFFKYLQERQDFIATISTGYIPYFSAINFKDSVYDELNWDKKVKRHELKDRYCENILLDNIARAEGFDREKIIICYNSFNGDKPIENSQQLEDLIELRKINISIPGGTIGRQAFFSIIENIIRNSAKHGGHSAKLILRINLEIMKNNPELFHVTITDKTSSIGNLVELKKVGDCKYSLTQDYLKELKKAGNKTRKGNMIDVNCHYQFSSILRIKKGFDDKLINTDGTVRESNKGLKEILISAAWLRNIDLTSNTYKSSEIIDVKCNKDKELYYSLYLPRAIKLIYITDQIITEGQIKTLIKFDWKILSTKDFYSEPNLAAQIIVLDKQIPNSNELLRLFHSRYLVETLDINELLEDNVEESLYNKYLDLLEIFVKTSLGLNSLPDVLIKDTKSKINNSIENKNVHVSTNHSMNGLIFFRSHLDTDIHWDVFKKKLKDSKPKFFESITGDNSTDRIIRNSDFTREWYLNIVIAALTKILIIDERIWNRITNQEKSVKAEFLEEFKKNLQGCENNQKQIIEILNNTKGKFSSLTIIRGKEKPNKVDDEILDRYVNECMQVSEKSLDDDLLKSCELIHGKNIEILTLDFVGEIMNLTNLHNQSISTINKEDLKIDDFIGSIKLNDYRFIVVHHSIVQKIAKYCDLETIEVYNKINASLEEKSKLIVHSGRSKPESCEILDNQSFIQFASLDNAVFDCKLVLSEQLYGIYG